MTRDLRGPDLAPELVDELCDLTRRAPSAGNTQGVDLLVLDDSASIGRYWDTTLPEPKRAGFGWPGLLTAPLLVVFSVDPGAYVDRYAQGDKSSTGLGAGADAWSVPFWWVDAGAAIENLLLAADGAGLGACLFGLFAHEGAVAAEFGVPPGRRLVATVAVGRHPHERTEPPGRSVSRPRRSLDDVIHRRGW